MNDPRFLQAARTALTIRMMLVAGTKMQIDRLGETPERADALRKHEARLKVLTDEYQAALPMGVRG